MVNRERIEYNPCIVVLLGPPFSGKSTMARELSLRTNIRVFDNNQTRWLYAPAGEEFDRPLVRSMAMQETYGFTHFKAAEQLDRRRPVAIAATYSHKDYVNMLREFADFHRRLSGLEQPVLRIIALEVSEGNMEARVRQRLAEGISYPEIPLEYALDLRRRYVPIAGDDVIHVSTDVSIDESIGRIIQALEPFRKR